MPVVAECEAHEIPEAICARDADKLEFRLQGLEYKGRGYEAAQWWVDNSRARIVTKSGRQLADQLLAQAPLDWLRAAMGEREQPLDTRKEAAPSRRRTHLLHRTRFPHPSYS